jgi:hypothetical protein
MNESHTTGVTVDRGLVAHAAVMTLLEVADGGIGNPYDWRPAGCDALRTGGGVALARVGMGGEDSQVLCAAGSICKLRRRATRGPVERQVGCSSSAELRCPRERHRGWKPWWRCC